MNRLDLAIHVLLKVQSWIQVSAYCSVNLHTVSHHLCKFNCRMSLISQISYTMDIGSWRHSLK
jgi:Mlc titration factor MtfA (ptsG expression regulator)